MARTTILEWTAAAAFAASVLMSATAAAQSSRGAGGPIGSQQGWPCPGCLFGTPDDYDATQPAPLLVTFHGDEGHPTFIHGRYFGNDRNPGPARTRGFLVLSLQCPVEFGCGEADPEGDPSWWRWRGTDFYDPEWVGLQVDAVEAAYDVSLRQVYIASFSGGSSFSRRYAFEQAGRFAGALIGGGGGVPMRNGCFDTCKIPIFISIGSEDSLYDLAQGTRQYADECGHELFYSEHPGVDHTIIQEDLPVALDWFLARPHPCIEPAIPPAGMGGAPGTGGAPGSAGLLADAGLAPPADAAGAGGDATGSGGSGGSAPVAPGSGGSAAAIDPVAGQGPTESQADLDDMLADHVIGASAPSSEGGSCGCRVANHSEGRAGVGMLVGLAAAAARRRHSRRAQKRGALPEPWGSR